MSRPPAVRTATLLVVLALVQRLAAGFRAINGGRASVRSARGEPGLRSWVPPTSRLRPAPRYRWRACLSVRCADAGRGKLGRRTWSPPNSPDLRLANHRWPLVWAAALASAIFLAGCASLGDAGLVSTLRGTVTLDRKVTPAGVYLEDPKQGRWRLEGGMVGDLRELDRALIEVSGLGDPRLPRRAEEPGTFTLHAYRLVEVGGKPALVGKLAWEGPDLMLVELDRDDQRVALAGPMVSALTALMGKSIWIAGHPRQGVFVVERYGVLRQ